MLAAGSACCSGWAGKSAANRPAVTPRLGQPARAPGPQSLLTTQQYRDEVLENLGADGPAGAAPGPSRRQGTPGPWQVEPSGSLCGQG